MSRHEYDYNVIFTRTMRYSVVVEAEDEEEAVALADELLDADPDKYEISDEWEEEPEIEELEDT